MALTRGSLIGFCALIWIGAWLTWPARGEATITMGSSLASPPISSWGCGGMPCTGVQVSLPGRVTVSPVNGTITVWRVRGSSGPTDTGRLRVLSPMGAPSLFRNASATGSVPPGTTAISVFPTSLPISIGDRVGLDDDHAGGSNFGDAGGTGGTEEIFQPIPANGALASPLFTSPFGELLFNADIEPTSTFAKPKAPKAKKSGIAVLVVTAPNPGTLEVGGASTARAGPHSAGAKNLIKPASATVTAPGDVTLKLKPTKATRKKLRQKGKAKGSASVTFTPTGGSPSSQTIKVRLRLG